jgi:hypothetical protein
LPEKLAQPVATVAVCCTAPAIHASRAVAQHPFTGLEMRFGCSTLERWYYTAKRASDPVRALRPSAP